MRGARYGCELSWRGLGERGTALRLFAALTITASCCLGGSTTIASAHYGWGAHVNEGVVAWGANELGELGIGTTSGPQICWNEACSAVPVPVPGLRHVQGVAAGDDGHGLALTRGGHVWAWGNNEVGQLGDGSNTNSDVPVRVCAPGSPAPAAGQECLRRLSAVASISASYDDSFALLRNGTVVAWGENYEGRLGDNSTANSSDPVMVCALGETAYPCKRPLRGVVAVSPAGDDTLALLRSGTVVAWGGNKIGELGDGSTTASNVPVAVSGLTHVEAIAAGSAGGMALSSEGTVMDWGYLHASYAGPVESSTPVPVEGLAGVAAIAANEGDRYALLSDGAVESWGGDLWGQLGAEEECEMGHLCRKSPEPIAGLSEVAAIAAGGANALALLKNGTVMAWGNPENGQIGNDAFVWPTQYYGGWSDSAPTPVCALSEVSGVASGGVLSLAYGKDGPGTACKPEPALRSGSPKTGPAGTPVTIRGDNFTGATKVTFYWQRADASFTVVSPTEIVAIAPVAPQEEGSPPRGPISVTTPVGEARGIRELNYNLFENGDPHFLLEE